MKKKSTTAKKAGTAAKAKTGKSAPKKTTTKVSAAPKSTPSKRAVTSESIAQRRGELYDLRDALHDESEADEDGFIKGGGFDRYGGFEGDGLS